MNIVDEKSKRDTTMIVLGVLIILVITIVLALAQVLLIKGNGKALWIDPLARGPRYRDGATAYNQYENRRVNVMIEIPNEHNTARYQRRHPSHQHKQTKPWMK